MPNYDYECDTPTCEIAGDRFTLNVPIDDRDLQFCARCGSKFTRKITFEGSVWAPTAGGMR